MDAVLLNRVQFAFTVGFHFIFPPLSIGLAWLVYVLVRRYKQEGTAYYAQMSRFWVKLLSITFVVGVATGITMEFQFGTNWAQYSRYVGDIFGAPLAAEAVLAFFLESTFMGVLLFGWKRVPKRVLSFAALMVAIGSTISAFWIIVANSWMQTPAGYAITNGRAELINFAQAVFNPSTIPRFLHTIDGAFLTGGMFMMGVSAWFILRKRNIEFAQESFKLALIMTFVAAILQWPIGHLSAVQVAQTQPEKLAAMEGLFETVKGAPLLLFGIPDADQEKTHFSIAIPGMLSLLTSGSLSSEIPGLKSFPKEEWPPLLLTFIPFHLMVGTGGYFVLLSGIGIYLFRKKKLFDYNWFMWLCLVSIPLPFISNELGWITAEVGRQPWIVYRLLKTKDAISMTVPATQVLISMIGFLVIYGLLFFSWIYLLRREIVTAPEFKAKSKKKEK